MSSVANKKESISCKLSTKTSSWYSPTMTDHKLSHHRRQSVNCHKAQQSFWKIELILHEWFWYTSDMKKIFPFNKICQLMKRKSSFMMSLWPMDSYFRILFKYPLTWNEGLKFYPAFKCKISFNKFTHNLSPTPPHIMRGVFWSRSECGVRIIPTSLFFRTYDNPSLDPQSVQFYWWLHAFGIKKWLLKRVILL